jgi:exopolysaccharide biosynthesis polyprenyl glycosylphosphotransferase
VKGFLRESPDVINETEKDFHLARLPQSRFTDQVKQISRKVRSLDLFLIALSALAAVFLRWGYVVDSFQFANQNLIIFITPLVWFIALAWEDAWNFTGFITNSEIYLKLLRSGVKVFLSLAVISFVAHAEYSRGYIFAVSFLGTFVLLIARKVFLRRLTLLRKNLEIQERVLTISCCDSTGLVDHADIRVPNGHYESVVLDFSQGSWDDQVVRAIEASICDYLFICNHISQDITRLNRISQIADQMNCSIYFLDSLHHLSVRRKTKIQGGRIYSLLEEPALRRSKAVYKRGLDILLSGIALIALTPAMAVIAFMVAVTSKGGIFYVDKRLGRGEQTFNFPKFRSMYSGSDKMRLEILGRPDESMTERYRHDPRITPVGRFLRRYSLDELPQLWSVFIGHMSIVGPRPILPQELVQMDALSKYRSIALPGLTGLWQINGRKETTWEERMAYDLEYIHAWSPSLDMTLIFRTVSVILSGKGSY